MWIVEKFEKRISHWCSRWLSLGGRLVLIKYMLESQPIYWLTLASLPSTIQTKIRQRIFIFLWSGGWNKKSIHLCNWQLIAKPKYLGGWGLRNLIGFSRAYVSNKYPLEISYERRIVAPSDKGKIPSLCFSSSVASHGEHHKRKRVSDMDLLS
jgi:hypothetical protein